MNFVKGFLRRGSGSQDGVSSTAQRPSRSSSSDSQAWPDVQFSNDGPEVLLKRLWEQYESTGSKIERQKALEAFLLKFNGHFERWVPKEQSTEGAGGSKAVVSSCVFGHPTQVVAGLVQELKRTSDFIAQLNASADDPFVNTSDMEAALCLLSALAIITRSDHNRTVFCFFGGLQLLTGLMKNAVVHVKTVSGVVTAETAPGSSALMLLSFLQCLLAHIVSITASFLVSRGPSSAGKDAEPVTRSRRSSSTASNRESTVFAPLLETGGLNWFVELLRVLRKLGVKGVSVDRSLEMLTLQTLKTAIAANPRAQNHFKSIGGLEVLLDGLGSLPASAYTDPRLSNQTFETFKLQMLSLEVTREAVYRNINCLQSLRECGGISQFIRLFRWAALSLPEYQSADDDRLNFDSKINETRKLNDAMFLGLDNDKGDSSGSYISHLCRVFYSFLVASGDLSSLTGPSSQDSTTGVYWESATRLVVNVLLGVFKEESNDGMGARLMSGTLQRSVLDIFKKMLATSPSVLQLFREEGVWTILFTEFFFYSGLESSEARDTEPLQLEVISFVELAATVNGNANNLLECSTLIQALEQCIRLPNTVTMILKSLHRILQLAPEATSSSFKELDFVLVLSEVMSWQLQALDKQGNGDELLQARDAAFLLFNEYLLLSEDAKFVVLRSVKIMDVLFTLICDPRSRVFAIQHISNFMKLAPNTEEDQDAKMELCMKYMEALSRIQSEYRSAGIDIICDLLAVLRDVLESDLSYYQALLREVECFVHVVSLLNEVDPQDSGRRLCLDVMSTLICLLKGNEASKRAIRSLVGPGYRMLQTLLIDQHQGIPDQAVLQSILDMLVDGKFEESSRMIIQNEDAIILLLNTIRQCDEATQLRALDTFLSLLEDSSANQASAVRAGVLCFLLDWFSDAREGVVIEKLSQLMQLVGGHSMSGKEMRKIFSLLRSTMDNSKPKNGLLLNTLKIMLKERGPSVFFEHNGKDSGISITTPLRWPTNKGYTFMCWIRLEVFEAEGLMGLFSFLTDDGRGCTTLISANKMVVESAGQKRQALTANISLVLKQWHFICITHSTGRALSTGSALKIYVDGLLVASEKFRFPKVYDPLTQCTIGAGAPYPVVEDNLQAMGSASPLCGQLGPVYLFDDVFPEDLVEGVYKLGPAYMYSFLPNEAGCVPSGTPANSTLFSSKEGIASKMIIGYNAQASSGRSLFNIAPESSENEAAIMAGTRLCYRRLVQDNIHCVGGITVFFPLLTHLQQSATQEASPRPDDSYVLDVLELLSAFLDRNFANQKLLENCGGLSLLGFLLQFVSFKQLSVKVVSALNTLLGILAQASDAILAESLVNECIFKIYLNPSAWIFTPYVVQRELYLSLLNFLENHASFNKFCSLPDFLDMLHQFYWDKPKTRRSSKTTHSSAGERPRQEEVSQLRILILSLAEGVLRSHMTMKDAKALLAYVDKTDDLVCLEDILQMLLGLLAEGDFNAKFVDALHAFGGVQIFLSLLKRQEEVIRLLTLQILGTLFNPTARKPSRLFGGSKTASDQKRDATIWYLISERVLLFPFTPQLAITLFDLLLGGSVSRTLLQGGLLAQFGKKSAERTFISRLSVIDPTHSGSVPQIAVCRVVGIILKCTEILEDFSRRQSILKDLLAIVDASPSNCELILQEQGWQDWLFSMVANIFVRKRQDPSVGREEEILIRKLLCALHSHAVCSIRGGWRHIERSVAYLQIYAEKVSLLADNFLCNLLADLLEDVLNGRPPQEALSMQPCRDNVLFVLSLVDELAARDAFHRLPFTSISAVEERLESTLLSGEYVDLGREVRDDTAEDAASSEERRQSSYYAASTGFDQRLYDLVWTLICTINGKGQDGAPSGLPGAFPGPSFGQRARGLVESLNIPAAEVAAAVTGGLGSVGINISSRSMEKALKLRGEKFLRLAFHMVLLYLYKAELEAAMSSVRHFLSVVPALLSGENEQSRSQLHLLLWSLLDARTHVGSMDDGARYHILSQLIQEVLQISKNILATSIVDKDKRMGEAVANDSSSAYHLLQQEKVLAAVKDARKFLRGCRQQWVAEVAALRAELREAVEGELQDAKLLEEQYQSVSNALYHFESNRRQAYQLKRDEHEQAMSNLWRLTLRNLTDERGPWSSMQFPHSSPLNWKLDKTEDPVRRRLKLKRNYHFDEKLLLAPTPSQRPASEDAAMSGGSRIHARKPSNSFKALFEKEVNEEEMQDAREDFDKEAQPKESSSTSTNEDDATEAKNASEDEVLVSVCGVLVSSKRKLAGRLEVSQGSLHFHLDHVVEGTGGSMVFDAAGTGFNLEDISRRREGQSKDPNIKQHRRWDLSQITAIYGTRYLLQHTALEIFFANSTPPIFFNFATQQIAKDLALKIISTRNGTSKSKDKSQIHYVDRKKALELAERARDSWRRRECSNFEYLMILNTLAGRSYNDLTQYPVLPWVLSDYTSEVLDLSNPSVYRDFSRPVGALDEKRFKVFEERYNNFSDPDIPSFYFGSHYSSMGIVLFYLLRVEPFTSLHRNLQGGKFDHADRLFHSIEAAYSNCLTNTSDVKELIPEFFYMPEFLTNMNKYFIGVKQDGMQIDDVVLPPWAKASPEKFIRLHREALESEYVSDHLHLWVDLIFGYKQRGKPAVEAANVFYYLTYEGAVELDTLNDFRQRASVEDQIANFGQTPVQLFRKKHPRRGPVAPILRPFYYSPSSITLTSSISSRHLSSGSGSDRDPSVVFLAYNDGKVVSVTRDMAASARLWLTPLVQGGGSFTFSSSQDFVFGLGQDVYSPHKLGGHYAETLELVPASFAALQVQPSMYLLTSGHWDNSFKVVSLSEARTVQSVCLHKDVVTCISVSADGTTVATGSRDTTVMVWDVVQPSFKRRSAGAGSSNSSSNLVVYDKPRHVLCGHDDVVSCVVVRTELDLVVSGSGDGTCILYTLRQGRYVRSVAHPSRYTISSLAVSQHGFLVLFSNDDLTMRSYSVNGRSLAEAELNGRLSSMQLSSCGEYLVCGGEQGVVAVRKMYSLELVHRYETAGYQIASLCVTPEDCFLVGTREGKVLVFAVEASPRRSSYKSRT